MSSPNAARKGRVLPHRHFFRFKITNDEGKVHILRSPAKVRVPQKEVVLTLLPEHVQKAMRLHGAGSTANCAGAICTKNHAKAFPHVVDGYVDFQYSKIFVSSDTDPDSGFPRDCYVYSHDGADIAKLNDMGIKGQKKLLADLRKNGPREIILRPVRVRPSQKGVRKLSGRKTGERGPREGHALRYAVAKASGAFVPV